MIEWDDSHITQAEALTAQLADLKPNDDVTLTPEQAALVRAALERLAQGELTQAVLERRLARFETGMEEITREVAAAVSRVRRHTEREAPDAMIDFDEMRNARSEFVRDIEASRSLRETIFATLTFIARLAPIL